MKRIALKAFLNTSFKGQFIRRVLVKLHSKVTTSTDVFLKYLFTF